MLYIRLANYVPVEVAAVFPKGKDWAFNIAGTNTGTGWISRNDIRSLAYAQTLAELLSERSKVKYLAADAGANTFPRYDVIEAPVLGAKVSKTFNGDSYPCGEITKITPTWQITTSTGAKFRRFQETAGWRETGGSFWMTGGHIDERNPHF
jgi:hypothetical protein